MSQQAQETVVVPASLVRMLLGEAPHEGTWFNEGRLSTRGRLHPFWWRDELRQCLTAPVSPDSDLLKEAVGLLREYRDKTPLGHQPHMIAARADAFLSKVEERVHD